MTKKKNSGNDFRFLCKFCFVFGRYGVLIFGFLAYVGVAGEAPADRKKPAKERRRLKGHAEESVTSRNPGRPTAKGKTPTT